MKKLLILVMIGLCQSASTQDVQWAHGISMSVSFPQKFRVIVSYDLQIRSEIEVVDEFGVTPLANLKVAFFSNHLGSSVIEKFKSPIYCNATLSYGGLLFYEDKKEDREGLVPVFTSVYHNTFNTEKKFNLGFATSNMWQFALTEKSTIKKKRLSQKLGNMMLSVGDFYLTYYNDGGPVLSYFGDKEDRYWTGGLTVGYLIRDQEDIHQVELAFDKFTGFSKYAFEATGLLHVDNVMYNSIEQFSYNTGRLGVKYINHQLGFGFSGNVWNIPFDLQDYLHRDVSNNPYHHKIEDEYFDVEVYKIYGL